MPTLLQKFTDKYYLRGVPNLLYKTRNLGRKHNNLYKDPDGINIELDIDNYFQNNIRYGYYEYAVRSLIKGLVNPGDVVLDIGGNIGYLACIAAQKTQSKGQVIVFEPNPEMIALINRNVSLNKYTNVSSVCAAVGEKEDTAEFFVGTEPALSTLIKGTDLLQVKRTIQVPIVSIDQYMQDKLIDLKRISFVKIDVEGYEYLALKGMKKVLDAKNATFIIENNPPAQKHIGSSLQQIAEEFFFPNHYNMYWLFSKTNNSIFYKKSVIREQITKYNIKIFNDLSGDFLAQPKQLPF
jgi:FkbM family methyltransferase